MIFFFFKSHCFTSFWVMWDKGDNCDMLRSVILNSAVKSNQSGLDLWWKERAGCDGEWDGQAALSSLYLAMSKL